MSNSVGSKFFSLGVLIVELDAGRRGICEAVLVESEIRTTLNANNSNDCKNQLSILVN